MRIATGLLALSLVSQSIHANPDLNNFITDVARTIEYVEKNQEAVWPGFRMADMPIVIDMMYEQRPDSLYAFNLQKRELPWQSLKFGNTDVLFLAKNPVKPDLYQYSGKIVKIDSQPSFINAEFREDITTDKNFMDYLTVEKATYYLQNQSKITKDHLNSLTANYDGFNDLNNLKLTYLENAALITYLNAKGAVREQALKDAAAIDKYRVSSLSPPFQNFVQANEIFFGLPHFISLQSKNLAENDYVFKAHQAGCTPLNGKIDVEAIYNCDLLRAPSFRASVFGYALAEKMTTAWKKTSEREFKTLGEITQEYYQLSFDQAKTMTEAAMRNPTYNYSRISSMVNAEMQPYLNALKSANSNYEKMSGVEFYSPWVLLDIFNWPEAMKMGIQIFPINTNKILRLNLNETGEFDGFFNVKFTHLPFVFNEFHFKQHDDIDNDNSWTIFKLQEKSMLVMDGQTITVGDFVKTKMARNFKHLSIKDSHMKLNVIKSGKIDASDGSLKLTIDDIYNSHSQAKIRLSHNN